VIPSGEDVILESTIDCCVLLLYGFCAGDEAEDSMA
jgi:hypothetical protein